MYEIHIFVPMLFSQPFLLQTPPRGTSGESAQITPASAVSARRRDWVPPIVKTTPSSKSVCGENFQPSFRTLTARERKILDMQGQLNEPKSWPSSRDTGMVHDDVSLAFSESQTPSNPRRTQSPLIPASMPWSTPLASNAPISISSIRRRAASDLLATTTPWTTQLPSSCPPSQTQPELNVRRQATDLIPQTMPWVTPFKTDQKNDTQDTNKYRRRKVPESSTEEYEQKKVDPISKSVASVFSFSDLSPSVLSLTETQVRSLLSSRGIHAVSVKFERNILTEEKRGKMDIVARYREGDELVLRQQLADLVSPVCYSRGG